MYGNILASLLLISVVHSNSNFFNNQPDVEIPKHTTKIFQLKPDSYLRERPKNLETWINGIYTATGYHSLKIRGIVISSSFLFALALGGK